MNLRKDIIIEKIAEKLHLKSQKEAVSITEILIEIIKKTLESGEDLMITNFGKFKVADKKERKGRNPATGSSMQLKERRVVTFKPSIDLKSRLNSTEKKKKTGKNKKMIKK